MTSLEKSLPQYKHLLAFDLTSYGSALAVINKYVDDENVKVFEVSPCGQSAILILLAKEPMALQVVKTESLAMLKSQILESCVIENVHTDLLPTYLSQNKTSLQKVMAVLEGGLVSSGLFLANELLIEGLSLVDFRVIRTHPKNVVITVTANSAMAMAHFQNLDFKYTYIEDIQPALKAFYEIS